MSDESPFSNSNPGFVAWNISKRASAMRYKRKKMEKALSEAIESGSADTEFLRLELDRLRRIETSGAVAWKAVRARLSEAKGNRAVESSPHHGGVDVIRNVGSDPKLSQELLDLWSMREARAEETG